MTEPPIDGYYKWLGIPPTEQPPNHYRLLGINVFEPDPDVIASAAYRISMHLRTFTLGPNRELSQRILNEVEKAKLTLLDTDRRDVYDAALKRILQSNASPEKRDVENSLASNLILRTGQFFGLRTVIAACLALLILYLSYLTLQNRSTNQTTSVRDKVGLSLDQQSSSRAGTSSGVRDTNEHGSSVESNGWVDLFADDKLELWQGSIGTPKSKQMLTLAEKRRKQAAADLAMQSHWILSGGVLFFDGDEYAVNLETKKNYRNFELALEWRITSQGDSGVYLRGIPQVQIWDPDTQVASGVGSGGLYNNTTHSGTATTRADRPVGQWNKMLIRMVGPLVTVRLNDTCVVDEVIMENFDNPNTPINGSGPIALQQHTGPVWFRNVKIRELAD